MDSPENSWKNQAPGSTTKSNHNFNNSDEQSFDRGLIDQYDLRNGIYPLQYNPRSKYKYTLPPGMGLEGEQILAIEDSHNAQIKKSPTESYDIVTYQGGNENGQLAAIEDKSQLPLEQVRQQLEVHRQLKNESILKHAFLVEHEKAKLRIEVQNKKAKIRGHLKMLGIGPSPLDYHANGMNMEVLANPHALHLDDQDPNYPNNRQLTYVERKVLSDLSRQLVKQNEVPFHSKGLNENELAVAMTLNRQMMIPLNDYTSGPGLPDVRRGLNSNSQKANIQEAEYFWEKQVSEDKEIRWDVFEEFILCYLEGKIDINQITAERINWDNYLRYLKEKLIVSFVPGELFREIPPNANTKDYPNYSGPVVSQEKWIDFVQAYGMLVTMQTSIEEFASLVANGKLDETGGEKSAGDPASIFNRRNEMSGLYRYACGSWYKGEWSDGRRHGKGRLTLPTGDVYEGDFVRGRRSGNGNMYYKKPQQGVVYKGEWVKDKREGYGSVTWPDGTYFQGKWEKGLQIFGTFMWLDRAEYTGHWAGPHMDGEGTYRTRKGETLAGEWKLSKLDGKGERRTPDGHIYAGTWIGGKLEGQGSVTTTEFKYIGYFQANKEHGRGKKTWHNGVVYEGDWVNGVPEGKGILSNKIGEVYNGDFKNGHKDGKGSKRFKNGDYYDGEWQQDQMEGYGTMTYSLLAGHSEVKPNQRPHYTGNWKDGKPDGQGMMLYEDESLYEGNWVNGVKQGEGKLKIISYSEEGVREEQVYVGAFLDDQFHGFGTLTKTNGAYYKGEWYQGKREGRGECRFDNGRYFKGLFNEDEIIGLNLQKIQEDNEREVKALMYKNST